MSELQNDNNKMVYLEVIENLTNKSVCEECVKHNHMQSLNDILSRICKVVDSSDVNNCDKKKIQNISSDYVSRNKQLNEFKLAKTFIYNHKSTMNRFRGRILY